MFSGLHTSTVRPCYALPVEVRAELAVLEHVVDIDAQLERLELLLDLRAISGLSVRGRE